MKSKIIPVKNIARLMTAADALIHRAPGMPGMGLVHGETGYGKSTAITWLINRVNGAYVRALATMTPHSLLSALAHDLSIEARGSTSSVMSSILGSLGDNPRPLFFDEADYIVKSERMTETLRDIHDMTLVPVVLIGMGGIDRKVSHRKQLTGRVLQDVRFEPADIEDARKLADGLCEVRIKDDLLDRVLRATRGGVRHIVIALARIELFARARGLAEIDSAEWGKKDEFFTGDAPVQNTIGALGKVVTLGGVR